MKTSKYYIIAIALILALGGGVAYYYANLQGTNDIPASIPTPRATTTAQATTSDMWFDPDAHYEGEYPKSPYTEPDPKLHIYEDIELDPEIITINYELKDITLCGRVYKTKQIFIDEVDVVQRLVQLLNADAQKNDWYCGILKTKTEGYTKKNNGALPAGEEIHVFIDKNGADYSFAPHIGISIDRSRPGDGGPTWEGGYPIYVLPKENRMEAHTSVFLGTLR